MSDAGLRTESLKLGYEGVRIVDGVDLTFPLGEVTSIIGRNGCGKSTILRALARLLKPQGGAVYLDGKAIQSLPTKEVARRVAMLPQSAVSPEQWSIFDLVAQGRYPHQGVVDQWSEADEKAVNRALELVHLDDLAHRRVDSLSGGQRQRAWIALALAQETEILLLDEPTTYLDVAHQLEILDTLAGLNKDEGRTIIMVLHDLNEAARYSDRIIAIEQGRVFADGVPSDVITVDMIRSVYGIDCQLIDDPVAGVVVVPLSTGLRRGTPATVEPAVR